MKLLNKKESDQLLGTYGFFNSKSKGALLNEVVYLGGIEGYDKLIENKTFSVPDPSVCFEDRPNGLLGYVISGMDYHRFPLLYSSIKYWNIESQDRITEKKSKSIVGRALVGGLLLGPIGAVVGGMTGMKDKETSKALNGVENILTICFENSNDSESVILFGVKDKNVVLVKKFFNNVLKDQYRDSSDIESEKTSQVSNSSSIDDLMKLKELFDSGLLTKEEFEIQKAKILK